MKNLKHYANEIILAFETKDKMKAEVLTVQELGIVLGYIKQYLSAKKSGISGTVEILNDYEVVNKKVRVKALATK